MKNWIEAPLTLDGEIVTLLSLEAQHIPELQLLGKEKRIWQHYVLDGSDSDTFSKAFHQGLEALKEGTEFPFVIYHKKDKRLIGSTRFLNLDQSHKKLEIGWTWLHPDYWGSKVNIECKLLLLTHCFENLKTVRVQLKTDELNLRSRKAIEKIGGKFEAIVRNDMIRDNGTKRNSAYYSIIDSEWSEVKQDLIKFMRD